MSRPSATLWTNPECPSRLNAQFIATPPRWTHDVLQTTRLSGMRVLIVLVCGRPDRGPCMGRYVLSTQWHRPDTESLVTQSLEQPQTPLLSEQAKQTLMPSSLKWKPPRRLLHRLGLVPFRQMRLLPPSELLPPTLQQWGTFSEVPCDVVLSPTVSVEMQAPAMSPCLNLLMSPYALLHPNF